MQQDFEHDEFLRFGALFCCDDRFDSNPVIVRCFNLPAGFARGGVEGVPSVSLTDVEEDCADDGFLEEDCANKGSVKEDCGEDGFVEEDSVDNGFVTGGVEEGVPSMSIAAEV